MTYYVAQGHVILPGSDWLDKVVAARREMDTIPENVRFAEVDADGSRSSELYGLLEGLEDTKLLDMEGSVVEDLTLTLMHFDEKTRQLVLAVIIHDEISDNTHATAFDRLFTGQYDPEVLQLTDQDTPYVVVRLDEHGQPTGPATAIQPYGEDTPEGVCATMTLPPDFVAHLLQLAA